MSLVTRRPLRAAICVIGALALAYVLSGCGSGTSTATSATPSAARSATPSATPTPTPSLATQNMNFTVNPTGGGQVKADVVVSQLIPASSKDQAASWLANVNSSSSDPLSCLDVDPQRDVLVVGSVAFTNLTPSFTPDKIYILLMAGAAQFSEVYPQMGIGYTSGAECSGLPPNIEGNTMWSPTMGGNTWGPVPFVVVVHHYYSPNAPGGSPSLLNGTPATDEDSEQAGVLDITMSSANGPITTDAPQPFLQPDVLGHMWYLGRQALSITPGAAPAVTPTPSPTATS